MSRSSSKPAAKVRLKAESKDNAAELFLMNWKLDRVARGIGRLVTRQPPGIYKLKVRAGLATHEELVVLRKDPVEKVIDHLAIPSAAPLDYTAQSHEYHQHAAAVWSAKPLVRLGRGGSLFVFARDWSPQGKPQGSGHHPSEGLTLCTADGKQIVDLRSKSKADLSNDPWAACRVDLNPGTYRLAITLATGETFEMAVAVQQGWQTAVFLLQREYPQHRTERRADLASASISMSRTKSAMFSPDKPQVRLAELARLALVDDRNVLTDELHQMLEEKYDNPMLGIIGAHLLLRRKKVDRRLLGAVVRNLRNVFGSQPNPDVEALALAAGEQARCDFATPPMLRASWELVVANSVKTPSLIPSESLSAQLPTCATAQEPWFIWRRADDAEYAASMVADLRELLRPSWEQSPADAGLSVTEQLQSRTPGRMLDLALTRGLSESTAKSILETVSHTITSGKAPAGRAMSKLATQLAKPLRMPPTTVERLIEGVYDDTPGRRGLSPLKKG